MAAPALAEGGRSRRWAKKPITSSSTLPSAGVVGETNGVPPPPTPLAETSSDSRLDAGSTLAEGGKSSRKGKGKGTGGRAASSAYGPVGVARSTGRGKGKGASLTAGPYSSGLQSAYLARYQSDLERLQARPDLPASARWLDSHCHLESILARTWRGGGKPQVADNEPVVDLVQLVESWPPGLDGCISNFAFRRPSKPGFPPEWSWLETNLHHFEDGPISRKLWFTIGIHPHDAGNWNGAAEDTVRMLGRHPKCVGVGECGLDFFKHDKSEAALQLRAFRAQAALAVELGKALVVHGRLVTAENEQLCLGVLSELVPPEHPIHIHCYSDSVEYAQELCKRWPNLRIGFTGSITFRERAAPKAVGKGGVQEKKGEAHCRALITGLPLDRMLLETDGPYMCPDPFRGQTAHPGHVHRVAERIAEWKGLTLGEVMEATRANSKVVYGI